METDTETRSAPRVERIKIFGERNTGTNFVEAVLSANVDCPLCPGNLPEQRRLLYTVLSKALPYRVSRRLVEADRDREYDRRFNSELGWKHARVPNLPAGTEAYPAGTGFVAVIKNPYAWLLSLHKRPYQNETSSRLSFANFLRTPWQTVERECAGRGAYDDPIQLWNDKVAAYDALVTHGPTIISRYEDIAAAPETLVERLAGEFGVACRTPITVPERSVKGDGRSRAEITAYYLNEGWRKRLNAEDIAYINHRLDPMLMARYGYAYLTALQRPVPARNERMLDNAVRARLS